MKRCSGVWILIALLVLAPWAAAPVTAAGTLTVTTSVVGDGVTKYTIAWTSTAGGAVSGNAFAVKRGQLLQVKFVPNTGATQPTDLYDATLIDTDSLDVLAGAGADLSNSAAKLILFNPTLFNDATQNMDLVIANAGNAKTGTVYLWVR